MLLEDRILCRVDPGQGSHPTPRGQRAGRLTSSSAPGVLLHLGILSLEAASAAFGFASTV